jgi:neurocan core protein
VKNEVGVGKLIERRVTTENVRQPYPVHINSPRYSDKHNEYLLTWKKPWTGGQSITAYDVRYRRVKVKPSASTFELAEPLGDWVTRHKVDNPTNPSLEFHLTGLAPNSHYQVEVYASNRIGKSPVSNSSFS